MNFQLKVQEISISIFFAIFSLMIEEDTFIH